MNNLFKIKKACGFYVSNMHFATMILPYVNKNLIDGASFYTFFEFNLEENIKKVLQGIIGKEEEKKKILKINWSNFEKGKYSNVEKNLKRIENGLNTILVCGTENYINNINECIEKFIKRNIKKIENTEIKIINCYEVKNFNENIKEILDSHDKIINTSGEHEISEVFKDYKKKVV